MCGRDDGDRVRAGRRAPVALLALLVLTGCGGAGSVGAGSVGAGSVGAPNDGSSSGETTSVLLFRDGFEDEAASAERWTRSRPEVRVDETTGTLPLDAGDVTTNAPPFEREGGELEFVVAMAWPTWCPGTGPHTSRPIQLVELDSGLVVASLVVSTSSDCTTLVAEYRIDPAGSITPSSVVNPIVTTPFEFADGFHAYRIVLLDDGRATWFRDGVAMIASFVPLSDRGYALRLQGSGTPGTAALLFDEVEVTQR